MVKMFVGFIKERGLIAENLELLISEFLKSKEADLRDGKIQASTYQYYRYALEKLRKFLEENRLQT